MRNLLRSEPIEMIISALQQANTAYSYEKDMDDRGCWITEVVVNGVCIQQTQLLNDSEQVNPETEYMLQVFPEGRPTPYYYLGDTPIYERDEGAVSREQFPENYDD